MNSRFNYQKLCVNRKFKQFKLFFKNKNTKSGFTLVELLTVLVIIGVILAITIPSVSRLMYNQNDKKLHALIDSALKASNVYIDKYKGGFLKIYDKYNFQYESLLNINYVKEEDIHCTGTMQATRKKGNNYTYSAYLMCKDKKGNVIYDNTDDLPAGGVSIMGKFLIDYTVKLNNSSGSKYNHDYTKENVYNEFMAYDLERPGTGAGISKFMYSYNNHDWIYLSCDQENGIGSFILSNTFVGKVYFKAYDMVGNESETLSYNVKVDKTSPTGTITLASTNANYNVLNVKANISASDNTSGSGVKQMCIQESSNLASCNWTNYVTTKNMTLSGTLNGAVRTVYAWFKDGVGNISSAKSTTYTPYQECSQVNFSSWSNCSKACGGGSQTRTAKDKFTNNACAVKNETRSCNTMDCCSSTQITGYGSCNKACGGGVKVVNRISNYNGQNCTKTTETVACNTMDCCSSKKISSYGSWSACNKTCGGGTQTRAVYYVSAYDSKISCGSITNGSVSEGKQSCNTMDCCSSKKISSYGSWSACNKTCGGGTQTRAVYYVSAYDSKISCGSITNGSVSEGKQSCNTQSCIQYRYRDIKSPTVKKTPYSVKSRTFYTCICSYGGSPIYSGKTMCNYSTGFPSCELLNDTSYSSSKSSYKCVPSEFVTTSTVTDYNKCVSYTTVAGIKICSQYGTKTITTKSANAPSCSASTWKYCDDMDDAIIGSNATITGCEKKTTTCDSGWTLSGGKCYGPWSAWSSTKVTATQTREVQTRQG